MYQIDNLYTQLLTSLDEAYPIGLADGKMGLCIYFYYLSHYEKNEEFKKIAEQLLDDVVNNLSATSDITIRSGLAGITIGIDHLIKEKFIGGDINEILEDLDSNIFNRLAFYDNKGTAERIEAKDLLLLLY